MNGNTHDLDFVLEKGGTPENIGSPVAFIETAWRRYTRHSKNKAQEIQGAIEPLSLTYQNSAPFLGVVLAGVFTEGALSQLQSLRFKVLYFPYKTIVDAFKIVGINADFDEDTSDDEFTRKVRKWEALPKEERKKVADELVRLNATEIKKFMIALSETISRRILLVRILPLHGIIFELDSIEKAISFIEGYNENDSSKPVVKYEVQILYNNGDEIKGTFTRKDTAIQFLRSYHTPPVTPP